MDDLERCQRAFLEKIFPKKKKLSTILADVRKEGLSDPIRKKDLLDGLPIPFGDFLLVNPF